MLVFEPLPLFIIYKGLKGLKGLKETHLKIKFKLTLLLLVIIKTQLGEYFMTKTDLINQISEDTNLTKIDVGRVLDVTINTIINAVKGGDKVTLTGFGTFMAAERNAREGRNPRTGEPVSISATKVPKFVAGKGFKEAVK